MAAAQGITPRERALRLYGEASEDYRSGRFEQAAARLREAYALYPEPVLLYNLARALEGSGALREAREAYTRYLAEAPRDAEERQPSEARLAVITELLARLEREDAEASPALAPREGDASSAQSDAPRSSDGGGALVGGVTLTVLGALTLGAGIGLAVHAVSLDDRARASSHLVGEPLHREAGDYATAANVSFVIGASLGLAGLTWTLVELSRGGATEGAAALRVTPCPGGLVISGHF